MFKQFRKTRSHLRRHIMGINERNIRLIFDHNQRAHYKLADDKILCKSILEQHQVATAISYGTASRIGEIGPLWESVCHYDSLVIKPAKGAGGNGILILRKRAGVWYKGSQLISETQICTHMAQIIMGMYGFGHSDCVLIEECIEPHPFFLDIYPDGVPDFRIILLQDQPIMAMLRMPTNASDGKANLHQGGLGIGIDLKAGTLQYAFDGEGFVKEHPDTGRLIYQRLIPYWAEMLDVSRRTSELFPLDYLGVDIILDRAKGPMVMEINVRPGLAIQLANQKGLKQTLKS
ncbi:MAG: alpha-L-glutamate ligase-like protein [Saprospiraceae bacterium]|nr:alpha-L-glutamate ligase-like protein [Saprospiraceae bacterium]